MTVRRFLIWYVGSLVFVGATGASSYRALESLHAPSSAPTETLALATPDDAKPADSKPANAKPAEIVADPGPVAATPTPPLPALRPHVVATPTPPIAHPVHRAIASASIPPRPPARQEAAVHRVPSPAPQQVVVYPQPAQVSAYYAYPRYYAYGAGYAYYVPYSRYPYYTAR